MSEPRYQVRPYQDGDEERILRLFNRVFGEGDERFQPRTTEQWQWEFAENPAGRQISLAFDADGELVAHYACLPVVLNLEGTHALAGQGIDSMVHPDHRRGLKKEGPFLAAARHYFETWGNAKVCALGFGYPNQRAFRIGVKLLGYVPVFENLPVLYRNFFEHSDDERVGAGHADALEVRRIERFDERFDTLWNSLEPRYPVAVVRDARYLNWRYLGCPHIEYECYEVRHASQLRGWFVLRAGWNQLPILAVTDLLAAPDDEAVVAVALRYAVRRARATEQARVELWLPRQHPHFEHALRAGFDTEPCNYHLCVMLYRRELELERIRRQWYYTIGDSDLF